MKNQVATAQPLHAALIIISLCLFASTVDAASFDCAKAGTQVEKMICADPELSKLDDDLGAAYSKALKESSDTTGIKQQQRDWLNERNKCSDTSCMKRAYVNRLASLKKGDQSASVEVNNTNSIEASFPQMPSKLRYAFCDRNDPKLYCEGQTGKGYTVCEAYLEYLQTLASPPTCEAPISPGFEEPNWEAMDVTQHLDLAYQAERLFLKNFGSYKHPDFETWRKTFLKEMQEGKINPSLKKARIHTAKNRNATIISYTRNQDACRISYGSDLQYDKKTGRRLGIPSHPVWNSQGEAGQLWTQAGRVHFILPNDDPHHLQEIVGGASKTLTTLILYGDQPYFIWILREYSPLYKSHEEKERMLAGKINGKSIVWMDNSGFILYAFDPRFPDPRPNLGLNHYQVEKRCQFIPH